MGRFLKKLGLFFFLLLATCLVLFGVQTLLIRERANFKFSNEYKYIMLGHSHAECAYNDSLIADFKNIATSGESYFYTYYKLKKVLEQNDTIKMVLVEFTNNQIYGNMDHWIWGDKYIAKFYPKYGSFISFRDTGLLLTHNSSSVINNFSVLQKRNLMNILKGDYNFYNDLGGYVHYAQNDLEKALIKQHETKKNETSKNISHTNLVYLEKIVLLCKQFDKDIVFIRSPQHSKLNMRDKESEFLEVYSKKFSEVPFVDFNDFKIPNEGFKDLEHLNFKGAHIISKTMDSLLQNKLIESLILNKEKHILINN